MSHIRYANQMNKQIESMRKRARKRDALNRSKIERGKEGGRMSDGRIMES